MLLNPTHPVLLTQCCINSYGKSYKCFDIRQKMVISIITSRSFLRSQQIYGMHYTNIQPTIKFDPYFKKISEPLLALNKYIPYLTTVISTLILNVTSGSTNLARISNRSHPETLAFPISICGQSYCISFLVSLSAL